MKPCIVDGCEAPTVRKARCLEHARDYSRERSRRFRAAHPEKARLYREANREKLVEKDRHYYEANREKRLEADRRYREANREKVSERDRRYREANREKVLEAKRSYREAHLEKVRERARRYYAANREKVLENERRAREANPEKTRDKDRRYRHTRRARRRNAYVEPVSPAAVYARDAWRCQLCRRKVHPHLAYPHPGSASLDHILPLSRGGTHEYANVQLAHLRCNIRKSAGTYGEAEQLRLIA